MSDSIYLLFHQESLTRDGSQCILSNLSTLAVSLFPLETRLLELVILIIVNKAFLRIHFLHIGCESPDDTLEAANRKKTTGISF